MFRIYRCHPVLCPLSLHESKWRVRLWTLVSLLKGTDTDTRNQVGIGLSYRPASPSSLATQFQTRFLESIPRPIAGLKFSPLYSVLCTPLYSVLCPSMRANGGCGYGLWFLFLKVHKHEIILNFFYLNHILICPS